MKICPQRKPQPYSYISIFPKRKRETAKEIQTRNLFPLITPKCVTRVSKSVFLSWKRNFVHDSFDHFSLHRHWSLHEHLGVPNPATDQEILVPDSLLLYLVCNGSMESRKYFLRRPYFYPNQQQKKILGNLAQHFFISGAIHRWCHQKVRFCRPIPYTL